MFSLCRPRKNHNICAVFPWLFRCVSWKSNVVLAQTGIVRYVLPLAPVSTYGGEIAFPSRRPARQVAPGEWQQWQQYHNLQPVPFSFPFPSRSPSCSAHAEVFTSLWEVLPWFITLQNTVNTESPRSCNYRTLKMSNSTALSSVWVCVWMCKCV